MADRFEQFRLSLLLRAQRDMFAPEPTREEYLRQVFGEEQAFTHYGTEFRYVAEPGPGPAILGRVGRRVEIEENLPPAEGLQETTHRTWKAAVLVLDPTDHEDGQKAALERDRLVGGPLPLITALVAHINEANPLAPYLIEVQPIFDASDFWRWVEAHPKVTRLTFDLVAPNGLFSARGSVRDELRGARAATGAEQVEVTLKSDEGIETNAEPIHEAVEYAVKGGGKIRAKSADGAYFSSTTKPATATLPEDADAREPLIVRAAKRVAEILGRE